jgi:hypothetical protein
MSDGRVAEALPLFARPVRGVRPPAAPPAPAPARPSVSVLLDPAVVRVRDGGFGSPEILWPRVWMSLPGGWYTYGVTRRLRALGVETRQLVRTGRRVRVYDYELDVRERVLEELRPGVVAMWADPLERFGVRS